MDLVTRKKLLMRKYNNDMFNNQELQFFNKINASQIIVLFKQNTHLRTCQIFLQHIAIRQVQKIIATIFEPQDNFYRTQTFNMLVNILKLNTKLLQICFNQEEFNYMSIFGFLEQQHIDYTTLILLEDILLPYIRKIPYKVFFYFINNQFIQIMQIFSMDTHVQTIIMNRIYQKPLFKIIYTVVFCLSKRHSQIYQDQVKLIISQLVNTPFKYLNHHQKILTQKSILNIQPTSPKKQSAKKSAQQIDINLSPVRKKNIRKSHNRSSNNSDQSKKSIKSPGIRPNQTNNKYTAFSSKIQKKPTFQIQKQKQKNQSNNHKKLLKKQSITHYFNHHHHQVDHYHPLKQKNKQLLLELQKKQSIPLNQDLDYADLTYNMRDLFIDLAFNIKSIYLKNVIIFLENINQTYFDSLLKNCHKFSNDQEYQGYCQGTICILQEFTELYKAVYKVSLQEPRFQNQNIQNQSNQINKQSCKSSQSTEDPILIKSLLQKLQKQLIIIASKIPNFCQYVLQSNQITYVYSSGENLKKVGLIKYKILQLIYQLLQLNNPIKSSISRQLSNRSSRLRGSLQNMNFYVDLKIKYQQFDLVLIVQKYLKTLKWNNLMHSILIKIMRLSLQQDYENFKIRYINTIQKPRYGFLGLLVQLFRNKKFVFLNNMKFINYGNLSVIYELSNLIIKYVQQNNDYQLLINKFPAFQHLVNKDLFQYTKNTQISQLFNGRNISDRKSSITFNNLPGFQNNTKSIDQSTQSIQQVLQQIQQTKRWNPSIKVNKTKKKSQSLIKVQSQTNIQSNGNIKKG